MTGYILCQTPMARQPYFIENIQMNIYSIEELCYYLRANLYLVDETIVNEEFCYWVSTELKLPQLASRLRTKAVKGGGLDDFLYPIFKEINYLSYEELKALNHDLLAFYNQSRATRILKKAQAFMRNGMYLKAIGIYQSLLADVKWEGTGSAPFPDFYTPLSELPERSPENATREGYVAGLLRDMGSASVRLFQMDKACEYFWDAFVADRQEKDLVSSLLALRSLQGDAFVEKTCEKLGTEEGFLEEVRKKVKEALAAPVPTVDPSCLHQYLDTFMKEYHRSMTP